MTQHPDFPAALGFPPAPPIPTDTSTPAVTDFADAFDDWIGGASVARRSLPIYGKPGLYAEYEQLERDLAAADAAAEQGTELAGSGTSRILARMEELHAEWVASKSTWTLEAVDVDGFDALAAAEPALTAPVRPVAPVTPQTGQAPAEVAAAARAEHEAALKAHETAMVDYAAAKKAFDRAMELRVIAAAVVRIEFADGRVADTISVAQLEQLRARLGSRQIYALAAAAQSAALGDLVVPAPFSRRSSVSDPTS